MVTTCFPRMGSSNVVSGELLTGRSEWRPVPRSLGVGLWSGDALQEYPRVVATDLGLLSRESEGSEASLRWDSIIRPPSGLGYDFKRSETMSPALAVSWLPLIIPDSIFQGDHSNPSRGWSSFLEM